MFNIHHIKRLFVFALVFLATGAFAAMPIIRGGTGKASRPTKVLLAGDSLMEGLGPQMQKALDGYENLTLIPIGKKSTGLSRPDFYNWPKVLEANLKKHRPDIVVMWVGTNDPQNIYGKTGLGEPCSDKWKYAYYDKLKEIVALTHKYKARLIFMGPPVMDKEPLNSQLQHINGLMRYTSIRYKAGFVDTRKILADKRGKYRHQSTLSNGRSAALRTPDRIHITAAGNNLVMDGLLPYMSRLIPSNMKQKSPRRRSKVSFF